MPSTPSSSLTRDVRAAPVAASRVARRKAKSGGLPVPAAALQRALADPRRATPAAIQTLQARYGNQAIQRIIQAKLQVGPARDRYEQEADEAAARVLRGQGQAQGAGRPMGGVQRAGAGEGFAAGPRIESRLAALQGQGRPLPDGLRARMEAGLNADFAGVRVHADPEAHQLNHSLQAQAFTHGRDIYMAAGKYDPASSQGQHLIAHELTHVVQQTGGQVQRRPEAEDSVQRFPANVLSAPINWTAGPFSTQKTGSVSLLKSLNPQRGDVASVVVQALVAAEGETGPVTLGANVANSRAVHAGAAEFPQLARALDLVLDEQGVAHTVDHRAIHTFMVMPSLPGQSTGDEPVAGRTEADMDELVDGLIDTNLLRTVGRTAALDGALGNFERLGAQGLDFGHTLVSDPQAHATLQFWGSDAAARMPEIEARALTRLTGGENAPASPGLLKPLLEHSPAERAARFVDALLLPLQNTQSGGSGPSYLADSLSAARGEMIALITQGYNAGVERLAAQTSGANPAGQNRKTIQGEAEDSWETLKAHTRNLKQRARGGLDHTMAAEFIRHYAHYRALKETGIPELNADNPLRFADLHFPAALLKDQPGLAGNAGRPDRQPEQAAQAARFATSLREFAIEIDKQNDDLSRLLGPARFSLAQMRAAGAPAASVDPNRQALLAHTIANIYHLSLSVLAYAEIYKLKGDAFMPGLQKLKGGPLKSYGPRLSIQLEQLFKHMQAMKSLHRRLEVHAE